MAERMEKITITLPKEEVAKLRERAGKGSIPSVSGYVAESVRDRLAREEWAERWRALTGDPTPEAIEWAQGVINQYWGPAERRAS
jgi:Arc/MetJ-type ribon-helix-helix transcriptional regulator